MQPHNIFCAIEAGLHACRLMVKLFICFLFKYDDEQCNKYYICMYYGITGYGVSRPGIQNLKDFCIKTTHPKEIIEF
jgi:hypothetical protein